MEYTSLNPFAPNASVFRRPDGVFELYLHLPGIISDLEVTPFSNYLLVSGSHFLPAFQSEDGREADVVWSDQPCGYFGRDIPLGMNNATEFIMIESSSCQNGHVVRFSIRRKEVSSTEYCGEIMQRGELTSATDTRLFRGHHIAPSTAQDAGNSSHSIIYHDASPLPNSAQQLATEDNSRRHVTFDTSSTLPNSTSAKDTGVHELSASIQELPVSTVLSNEQAVEVSQNLGPVGPVFGDTFSNIHSSSQPVLLPTDQTSVPIQFPDEHANHTENSTGDKPLDLSKAMVTDGGGIVTNSERVVKSVVQDTIHSSTSSGQPTVELSSHNFETTTSNVNKSGDSLRDHPALNSSGEILTSPAQNVAITEVPVRQNTTIDSGDGDSGNAQNNNPDIRKDGPSGFVLAGSSEEKVLASSSQRESGSVPGDVPNSLGGQPENGDQQPSVSPEESAEHKVEFSADRDSRDDPSTTHDNVPAYDINRALESSQNMISSDPKTIHDPTEGESGAVSMQQNADEGSSGISEPPRETHAVDSTSTPLSSSETALHHLVTKKEDGNAAIKDPVIPQTESFVDQGSVATAPPEEQVEASSPQKDLDDKLPATSQNSLGFDTSTTDNNVVAPSAEEGDVAVPVHEDESPRDEPTDSTQAMNISTESLDDGLVKVSKERGDGRIDTPRQTPEESNSVSQPFANSPTGKPSNTPLSYAQVAKKPQADHTSRDKSGSPQSSYDFFTGTPDVSTPDDRDLSKSAEPPTQLPSDVSVEKADGTSVSISDGLHEILTGDTASGQPSDLVMPSYPLPLDERSPETLDV